MMKTYKIIVAYDGTCYHGFAKQNNAITIQETLETAIEKIIRQPIQIIGAGRTDTGVHAKRQCCIFEADTCISTKKLLFAINSKLPKDIVIKELEEAEPSFHPRFAAKRKTYRYQILNSKISDPFLFPYVYLFGFTLDIEAMKEASRYMIGEHDFKCFCSAGSTVQSTVRIIYDIHIKKKNDLIIVDICGNGFLYNMVRIIIGTLLQVGQGRLKPQEIQQIIKSKDRTLAGPTAPPQGLIMLEINYKD